MGIYMERGVTGSAGPIMGTGTSCQSSMEDDGDCVADADGGKRNRAVFLNYGATNGVGGCRGVRLGFSEGDTVPLLVSDHSSLGSDEHSLKATAGAEVKVEQAVPSYAGTREGVRQRCERAAPSGQGVVGESSSSSNGSNSERTRRLRGWPPVLSHHLGVSNNLNSGEARKDGNMKLEVGFSSPRFEIPDVMDDAATSTNLVL